MHTLNLSVRELSQPNHRRGHIDMFSGYQPELARGAEIHRTIQERCSIAHVDYQKEFYLNDTLEHKHITVAVSGRIDSVFRPKDQPPLLEEIKSTSSLSKLIDALNHDPEHPYLLQCKTYIYLYRRLHDPGATGQLRLVSSLNMEEKVFEFDFDDEAYEAWLERRLECLADHAKSAAKEAERRKKLGEDMPFPFEQPRPFQKELVDAVKAAVDHKKQLLVQAPTGLGKTAGVLYPSLTDALRRGKQTVYITPKNTQHQVARETASLHQKSGHRITTLTLTAKSKVCMQEEPLCSPDHCPYAKNYYDKVSENGIHGKLRQHENLDADVFRHYATEHEVCPFELSLEATQWSDLVICDYNYIFSPRITMARLYLDEEGAPKGTNLVIDEAHNIPNRITGYFSPTLSVHFLETLLEREEELPKSLQGRWRKLLKSCLAAIAAYHPGREVPSCLVNLNAHDFLGLESAINGFILSYFELIEGLKPNDPVSALQRYWSDFCYALQFEGDEFFVTYRQQELGHSLKITCCDASSQVSETLRSFSSVVAFSATLKPFDYYRQLSGFDKCLAVTAEFDSPFPKEHRKLLVIPQVSTRYRDRIHNYPKIGQAISKLVTPKVGNYFVFFPSYDFMEKTLPHIDAFGYRMLKQERKTTKEEADAIIAALKEQSKRVLVLAVQGGVFAEGVDYPGETLIGAIIVGPALPNYNFEQELLRKYFDEKYGDGFSYAYVYPGMTKVVQSAGRVIRSESDRGMIVLLDRRFVDPQYTAVMPDYWFENSVDELVSTSILDDLEQFWEKGEVDASPFL